MKSMGRLFFLLVTCTQLGFAQQKKVELVNKVYASHIKTVQCYPTQQEQSLPVISLQSGEQLVFSFDDLQGGRKNYSYTIAHCTGDWKLSGLPTLDYVVSFAEDLIQDAAYSSGTQQKYTHYRLQLPNEQVNIKRSGNYILQVFDSRNPDSPVITQQFYVVENLLNIQAQIAASPFIAARSTHQKVNYTLRPASQVLQPQSSLRTVVIQNGNVQTALIQTTPSFISAAEIRYSDLNTGLFEGGNEFRRLDIRADRNEVLQVKDQRRDQEKYVTQNDQNGKFYIRSLQDRDPDTESDYVSVNFSLTNTVQDEIYITGGFNNYQPDNQYKLNYDEVNKCYTRTLLLKQGIYDYQYVVKTAGKPYSSTVEGSFVEARNAYQILVYYRQPGSRWEQLIGYLSTQTDTLPAAQ